MTYRKKVIALRCYVNFGYNTRAKDFVNFWYFNSLTDDIEKQLESSSESKNYIDNIFYLYRKQFPKSDNELQKELRQMQMKRQERVNKQFSLFN